MPVEITSNHLIAGDDVRHIACPKNSQPFANAMLPDTIVIHFTAGSSPQSSAGYLARNDVKASAHLVIGRDGSVYQLVPFNIISWHAGVSTYGNRTNLNSYSIGIELDNAGSLTKTGNSYISSFWTTYPESETVYATHRNETVAKYWHAYTEVQLAKCRDICIALIESYKIKLIVGHEEIAPGRKTDPGPAFPLDKLRNDLLLDVRKDPETTASFGKVTTSRLNIRVNPGINELMSAQPLAENTVVKIVEARDGWFKVRTEIEGWVKSDFIQQINP